MLDTLRPAPMLLAAAITLGSVGPATATISNDTTGAPAVHPRGCVFFQQADFRGEHGLILESEDRDLLGRRWDNQISSVQCASSCRLLAYDRSHFAGERRDLEGTVGNLGADWDDKISSMAVNCRMRTEDVRVHPTR